MVEKIRNSFRLGKKLVLEFWQTNKLIAAFFGLFIGIPLVVFRDKYLSELFSELSDPKWWATNLLSFLVFTVIVGFIVLLNEKQLENKRRVKFEGWNLIIKGFTEESKPQSIFWSDVEKFESSEFEKWKFVKSAVSNICRIKTKNLLEAKSRWLSMPKNSKEKCIEIDFSKMIEDDIINWNIQDLPNGWDRVHVPKPPDLATIEKAVRINKVGAN